MAQCPVAICPVTVHCPVVQCPTILLQVSECCILHSVYLCVSVTAYRLLNMHSAYFVGHLLHSYLQSELFMCVEPHRLSTNCILSASCASCAHTFVHFSNSCLHRASLSLCSVNSPTLGVAAVLQSPGWPMASKRGPTLPPSLLSHEAILDRNKSKKQCIRLYNIHQTKPRKPERARDRDSKPRRSIFWAAFAK